MDSAAGTGLGTGTSSRILSLLHLLERCVSCSRAASRVPSAVPVKKPIARSPFSSNLSCPVHYWPGHCTGVYPELSPVSCVRTKCGAHIWQLQISHHLAPSLSSHIAFIQSKNVTRTQFQNGTKSYPSNVTIRQSSNLPITQPSMSP